MLSINSISAATETGNATNTSEQNITSNVTNSSNTTIQNCMSTVNKTNSSNTTIQKSMEAAGGTSYSKVKSVWIPSDYVSSLNVTALQNLGITDVFVKSNLISTPSYSSVLTAILQKLKGTNIRVHAWITCFKDTNGDWIDPANKTQQNFLINSITGIVKNYNVSGINLDYVRYSGSGSNIAGESGTAAITAFVQLVYNTVKSINSSVAVSADLMPEGSSNAYYYGQNYTQLAQYLDFLVPMIYKGNYGYNSSTGTSSSGKNGTSWIASTVAYIVSQANGTPVIAGLQTYRSDKNVTTIPAGELQNDINAAINNGSSGYALFRYGLINSSFGMDSTIPTIKSIDPANNSVNVPINKVIKVTFSEPVKAGTLSIYIKNSSTGKYVPITTSISSNVLTITLNSNLTKGTAYSIILNAGSITDLAGNALKAYTTKFTTDATAPTVKSIDPANNSVNIPINKTIKITFSEPVKAGTLSIYLKNLKTGKYVTVTKKISSNILTITPTISLTKATLYYITLNAGSILDLAGNAIKSYTTKFTTDYTAPTVKSIDPTNNSANIAVNKVIKVTFSEPVKAGTLSIKVKNLKTGKYISIAKKISGNTLTITSTSNLIKATQYSVILNAGSITDLAGNAIKSYTTKFTTDKTAPTVKNIDPSNNSVNIAINKVIKITFSEPVKAGTLSIKLKNLKTGTYVSITKTISGNTLTIKPTSTLTKATQYSVILNAGSITDLAGNAIKSYTTKFTTDSTAPTVKSIDPSNNSVNIPINKTIKITFSESIKTGTGTIYLKNLKTGNYVSITKTISGNTLTIKPTNNLIKATQYSVILNAGSILDLAGNAIKSYTTKFTTDSTAPTVKSIDPANNSANVPLSKVIKVTFSESIKAGTLGVGVKDLTGKYIPITTSISGNVLTITPKSNLTNGTLYYIVLNASSVTDLAGNALKAYNTQFTTNGTIFTITQINAAAASVKSYVESNNRLPNYVTIGTSQVKMPQFLQLLVTSLLQINNKTNTFMIPGSINAPASPNGSYMYGNIVLTEYLSIAQNIHDYINSNNCAPNYMTSSLGNIQYESLVYIYSKILNYYKTNGNLPNYVLVDSSVTNTAIPSELQQYLQSTTNCQVTSSSIKSLAASITSGKTSVYDKAVAIFNWVRDKLGYSFYYNTKYGAVGTLNAMTGNCVDTAHLLIALERAAGIPARYEHVYAQFSSGNWYGHVIAQVWVNGKWYNADATSYSNSFGIIKNWNTSTATYKGTYATLPF
ncbi:Ig-like domain-containing protein [Methanobacterium sp. MBAC-LM]|uniref:Ig-like domain-containing protein n=1 Tax=Methanobacterium sp. MBAC-LM TaxID=3412034 RepID=UPI003C71762E